MRRTQAEGGGRALPRSPREGDEPALSTARDPRLVALSEMALARVGSLAVELADLLSAEIEFYRDNPLMDREDLLATLRANLGYAFTAVGAPATPVETSRARADGRARAVAGVPLPLMMHSYRIGARFIWHTLMACAREMGTLACEALLVVATDVWAIQDDFIQAMADGYQEQLAIQLLAQERERSALVAALLEGRVLDGTTVWDIADILGISNQGPYVVVAAAMARSGQPNLPDIDHVLRTVGLRSTWRLMPDMQVGIICLDRDDSLGEVTAVLRGRATGPVGVSPAFGDLAGTARALRLARIALAGTTPAKSLVSVFEDDTLAVAAVAAPTDIARGIADQVLAGLDGLPGEERSILLATFQTWLETDGSAEATGDRLFCHPNTIRRRLRRLEECTGKKLTRPRELTELCLALEIESRLPRDRDGQGSRRDPTRSTPAPSAHQA